MDFICLENKEWINVNTIIKARVENCCVVFDTYYSDYYGIYTVTYRSGFKCQLSAQDTLDYVFQYEINAIPVIPAPQVVINPCDNKCPKCEEKPVIPDEKCKKCRKKGK
jgi:hypothetical protein